MGESPPARHQPLRLGRARGAGAAPPVFDAATGYPAARVVPRAAEGVAVRVPGDRSEACRALRLEQGIPLSPGQWDRLVRRLAVCGIAMDAGQSGAPRAQPLAADQRKA